MEPNIIQPFDHFVVQKALGGIPPQIQLQLSPQRLREYQLEREAWAQRIYNHVARERAEATARGVHVVVDETRPDRYVKIFIYDEDA